MTDFHSTNKTEAVCPRCQLPTCGGHNRQASAVRPLKVSGGTELGANVVRAYIGKPTKEGTMTMGSGILAADGRLPDAPQPRPTQAQVAWAVWAEKAKRHHPRFPAPPGEPGTSAGPCVECGAPPMESGYCADGDWARHHLIELRDFGGKLVEDADITPAQKAAVDLDAA